MLVRLGGPGKGGDNGADDLGGVLWGRLCYITSWLNQNRGRQSASFLSACSGGNTFGRVSQPFSSKRYASEPPCDSRTEHTPARLKSHNLSPVSASLLQRDQSIRETEYPSQGPMSIPSLESLGDTAGLAGVLGLGRKGSSGPRSHAAGTGIADH